MFVALYHHLLSRSMYGMLLIIWYAWSSTA